MSFNDEQSPGTWTRGDLNGEWSLSHEDIDRIFGPGDNMSARHAQSMAHLYSGSDSMRPHMTSKYAMVYNPVYRNRQEEKMHLLPWDVNLLNAYHNLHFILYMAGMAPNFNKRVDDGTRDYYIDVPAKNLWVFQLIMKAASDCLRDDYIKMCRKKSSHDYRVTPIVTETGLIGLELHIVGDCLFDLYVEVEPRVNPDGTLGCKHKVTLESSTWEEDMLPLEGNKSSKNPLKQNMIRMRDYVKEELARFSRMLRDADFNRPEYALAKLGGE